MINDLQFKVISGREVTRIDIQQAVEFDKIAYPGCKGQNLDNYIKLSEKNPDIYFMVKNLKTNRIIAYFCLLPITDVIYKEIKRRNGFLNITPDMILRYNQPEIDCIFLSSVVVQPRYRSYTITKLLFDTGMSKMLQLARNNIFMKKVLAFNINQSGKKFDKLIGMKPTQENPDIYEVSGLPPQFRITTKITQEIYNLYKKHYDETRY